MYNAVDVIVKYVTSYRHCTHSMQSRVYETVKRPSVCTIIRSQQRRAAGLLLSAEQPSCNTPQHGALQHTGAVSC